MSFEEVQGVPAKGDRDQLHNLANNCVCLNLRKAARIITRRYDEAMAGTGLRSTQAPILMTLRLDGPMTMSELAGAMAMDNSTLSRNFKLLEVQGLVHRTPRDGRTVDVSVTDAGEQALDRALAGWVRIQEETVEAMGESKWGAVLDALGLLEADGEAGA